MQKHLRYKKKTLHIENVSCDTLVKRYGTPLYAYSQKTIEDEYAKIEKALRGIDAQVRYAVKANPNPAIIKLLSKLGAGFDAASEGELRNLRTARVPGSRVHFTGPGKTEHELRYAIEWGIHMIIVESLQETELIDSIAKELDVTVPIAIRINPDITIKTHDYTATGERGHKFGVDEQEMLSIFNIVRTSKHLSLIGLHAHVGCHLTSGHTRARVARALLSVAETLNKAGAAITTINIGGGLPVDRTGKTAFDHQKYFAPTRKLMQQKKNQEYQLLIEPGQRLVAQAGTLLSQVLYEKETYDHHFTIIDAAMNDYIRPPLYGSYPRILPLTQRTEKKRETSVVGPVCETGDFMARHITLPPLQQGDYLAILDTGAYGRIMSSNYGSRPRAAEVLIRGNRSRVIRKGETYEDIL